MKRTLLFLLLVSVCMFITAQDVIIKKGGQVINCRIISADSSKVLVKYNIDGYSVDGSIKREEVKEMLFNFKSADKPEPIETIIRDSNSEPFRQEMKCLVSAGVTLPVFKGDARLFAESYESSIDLHAYPRPFPVDVIIGFEQRIRKDISIVAGFEYAQKGMIFYGLTSTGNEKLFLRWRVNYLELPLCAKIAPASWMRKDNSGFYFKTGIAPAFVLNATYKQTIYTKGPNNWIKTNSSGEFGPGTDFDINLLFALGYKFNDLCSFDVIYEQGSLNVMDYQETAMTFYNRSFMFNIVYCF